MKTKKVNGKFILKLANEKAHYVGSTNQRVIDVPKTLKGDDIVLYIDNSEFVKVGV